mmetsp:Transcript_591/g.1299  ORF Transcript_591/g.1299 Transcript_591/m.1299 type:complete len:140 (-) Transcript_591:338-757(-)
MLVQRPKRFETDVVKKMKNLREESAHLMVRSRKIQQESSIHLRRHFETIPHEKLSETIQLIFDSFDWNGDGELDRQELAAAIASMGCFMTAEQLDMTISNFDEDDNHRFSLVSCAYCQSDLHFSREPTELWPHRASSNL